MSTPYNAITAYLETKGLGTRGTNLFMMSMPQSPDNCICIFPTPGINDPNNINQPYAKGTFQVMVRNTRGDNAETIIYTIYDELHNLMGVTLSEVYFVEIVGMQDEYVNLGKDSMNRFQLVWNFRFETYRENKNKDK